MLTKKDLRKQNKELRKNLDIQIISKKITANLYTIKEFQNVQNIFCYISTEYEVDTSSILSLSDKQIFVPKILKKEMIFTKYTPDNLIENHFGIKEPLKIKEKYPTKQDIIIIPGLAADINFNRIGYGGGYYDKYLSKFDAIKILLIPDKLFLDEIPVEETDIKMDYIVTETKILAKSPARI